MTGRGLFTSTPLIVVVLMIFRSPSKASILPAPACKTFYPFATSKRPKSRHLSTRKTGAKTALFPPFSLLLTPFSCLLFSVPTTINSLYMSHLPKRPTFRSFASSSKQKRKVPLNLRHFVRIIHKVESLLSFRVNPQGDT